jgi:hypothetical protein
MTLGPSHRDMNYGSEDRALQECNPSAESCRGLRKHPPAPEPFWRGAGLGAAVSMEYTHFDSGGKG